MSTKLVLSIFGGVTLYVAPSLGQAAGANKGDAEFLKLAAEADMTTTHIGKMAEARATTDETRDFGRKLAQEHASDYRDLSELAAKTGETLPKGIDKQDNREIAILEQRKGKAFDRAFLAEQSAEHEKLVTAFRQEAEHGDNPEIKAYANKALPIIEGHLHEAQDLLKSKTRKA